jgi:sulfofructose kinase
MAKKTVNLDVLCAGHACYDLVFSVKKHPGSDEKIFADNLVSSGGGPAANAAIAISRLGLKSGFAGYLGDDLYGEMHLQEFIQHHVDTQFILRGSSLTPLSTVLVKPDGKRALINYKGSTKALAEHALDFSLLKAKVILFDGHEPEISIKLFEFARQHKIPTVLDAGSLHAGTEKLMDKVDYLVASEKFACQYAGDVQTALSRLAKISPAVVITLGEKGLIWQRDKQKGKLPAKQIKAIDTTGAGDAFHGAFAAAIAKNMDWPDVLAYSSVAGTLCCTKMGARQGLPWQEEHSDMLAGFIS